MILKIDVEELSKNRIVNFQECSAMTQEGIWEGVTTLIEIYERIDDPSKTGHSTGATDSTVNKEASSTGRDSIATSKLKQQLDSPTKPNE